MTDTTLVDELAGVILTEIRDMQTEGYLLGTVHRVLPPLGSFSEIHNFIDGNVGWSCDPELGELFNAGDLDTLNAVFDKVDVALLEKVEAVA